MSTRSGTENKLNPQILWIYNRKENGFWKQKGINFALLEVSIHNFFLFFLKQNLPAEISATLPTYSHRIPLIQELKPPNTPYAIIV